MTQRSLEVPITAGVKGLADSHPAAQAALAELVSDLRTEPELRISERTGASQQGKGILSEVIITLGSAGSLTALVKLTSLWLHRDRHRTLTISITEQPTGKVINIQGDNISLEALTAALNLPQQRGPQTAPIVNPET